MKGGGALKYLSDRDYYLIGFTLPKGQFIAAQAIADGSSWAMQGSRVPQANAYVLYNKQGTVIGSLAFEDGQAMSVFENSVREAMIAYNGQEIYFEPDYELELPADFVVIP